MEVTLDPTPVEIREQCRRIQDTWTDNVRRSRAAWAYECEPVELRQVELLDRGETSGLDTRWPELRRYQGQED